MTSTDWPLSLMRGKSNNAKLLVVWLSFSWETDASPTNMSMKPEKEPLKRENQFLPSCILFGLSSVKSKQYSLEKNANLTNDSPFWKKHPFLVVTFVQPFRGDPPSIDINRSSLGSCTDRWAAEQGGDGDDVMWVQWPVDNPQELAVYIGNYGFTQQRSQAMLKCI